MSDPDDISADDVVTYDDLPEAIADALDGEDVDLGDGHTHADEDAPWLEPDDAAEITERKMTEFMHHLVHEDCDTPECKEYRDAFGIGGDDDPGAGSSEGGADADGSGDGEADEPDDPEPDADADGDSGNDGSDDQGSTETPAEPDGSESGGSDSGNESDESETNYLGEEI